MATVPPEYHFILPTALRYGTDAMWLVSATDEYMDSLSETDMVHLYITYNDLKARGVIPELGRWITGVEWRNRFRGESGKVWRLLLLFRHLGRRDISPFNDGELNCIDFVGKIKVADWSRLPDEFSYIIESAERFGRYEFVDEVDDFVFNATPVELQELKDAWEQITVRGHEDSLAEWTTANMSEEGDSGAWLLHWMYGLMEATGIWY